MNSQDILLNLFAKCRQGRLVLTLPSGDVRSFGSNPNGCSAIVQIRRQRFFRRVVLENDIGLGESFIDQDWDSPDPGAFLRWLLQNRDALMQSKTRWAMPAVAGLFRTIERIQRRRQANTLVGSRRNIEAHYDLGNDFYELFLDESMTYSSAYFANDQDSLSNAQKEKYERICRKLNLRASDRVLEIGCGWGGFAEFAAARYGCHITGITISPNQLDFARSRIQKAGLQDKVALELVDYRQARGQYDKIVSIEMIEAVGHEYLPSYFKTIDRLLSPDGLACIQIILSADHRYGAYLKDSDFIRKRIFPGSNLPSFAALFKAKAGLELDLYHSETFGLHYARTLELWRRAFERRRSAIQALGFNEEFVRAWLFYFHYCEAGFLERHINVGQIVIGRMNTTAYRFELATSALNPNIGAWEAASA